MLVSWDKVTLSFASVLSFSCLNLEALFISKFIFRSTPHFLRHSREQLWAVMGRCLEMVLLHSACPLSGFIEHGKNSLALWQVDFQTTFTDIFPFHIKKHKLYTLLSMLTFHSWYPHIFSLSLDGRDGNWGALFKQNMLSFLVSVNVDYNKSIWLNSTCFLNSYIVHLMQWLLCVGKCLMVF